MVRSRGLRHVVLEGLPAAGKSEILEVLSRFYPERVKVLPEVVKEVATRERIDLFRDRAQLTAAILAEIPRRRLEIEHTLAEGRLCLEESHLGVHLAYSLALDDRTFIDAYARVREGLSSPDLFLRLEIPIDVSIARQRGRQMPQFEVTRDVLERMREHLHAWHLERKSPVVSIDADRPPSALLAEIEKLLGLGYTRESRSSPRVFPVLLLLGRPASGKSEFIDFMARCSLEVRSQRYHIGRLQVVDDFPLLWEKFEEDDLWESLGRPRMYSRQVDSNYVVTDPGIWPFLIGKINQRVDALLSPPDRSPQETVLVEFSRGGERAYTDALHCLSREVLSRAAILYVAVSPEESLRRNLARYDGTRRGGILTHSVPVDEMANTYARDDWPELAPTPHGHLESSGIRVPYVTLLNEPESTAPNVLDDRYQKALDTLCALWLEGQH